MKRTLLAFWDEDRQEVEVRRPTGQVFRFSARQAVAGGHEVFAVETEGDLIVVLNGNQWSAAAHVESAVHADWYLPGHLGTLTGLGLT